MSSDWIPDVPGRGAWTLKGGLVNNSGGVSGYYQLPAKGPAPGERHNTDSEYSVWRAVQHIQRRLHTRIDNDLRVLGVWNEQTQQAMMDYQEMMGQSSASGVFGPKTATYFWKPSMLRAGRKYTVPWRFLAGMTGRESNGDPAAVGVNGWDHGLIQINLDAHGDTVTRDQALSPDFAYGFAAFGMRKTCDRWKGKTTADLWDIAIANHNSPALAAKWAETGVPPYVEGRVFQIEEYVIDIRARGERA